MIWNALKEIEEINGKIGFIFIKKVNMSVEITQDIKDKVMHIAKISGTKQSEILGALLDTTEIERVYKKLISEASQAEVNEENQEQKTVQGEQL